MITAAAPGRVELLGNHTDYNEGVVLGAAIDRRVTVSGCEIEDEVICLRSTIAGELRINMNDAPRPLSGGGRWANYSLGVVDALASAGVPVGGFAADIASDLPAGHGLGSSAALTVATALFVLKLCGRAVPPALELAKICQRAEHDFAGVQSGLLDQICTLFGRENSAVFFDARSEEVRHVPLPENVALIVTQTGVPRELARAGYNQRRAETHAAATALGVRALRDVDAAQLHDASLQPLLKKRALHIVGENARVRRAVDLLEAGDLPRFGELMYESHESSRTNFENSSPELDLLVETARPLRGVFGARLTGGGFGGATITLCEAERAKAIAASICGAYAQQSGRTPDAFVCHAADGAR